MVKTIKRVDRIDLEGNSLYDEVFAHYFLESGLEERDDDKIFDLMLKNLIVLNAKINPDNYKFFGAHVHAVKRVLNKYGYTNFTNINEELADAFTYETDHKTIACALIKHYDHYKNVPDGTTIYEYALLEIEIDNNGAENIVKSQLKKIDVYCEEFEALYDKNMEDTLRQEHNKKNE